MLTAPKSSRGYSTLRPRSAQRVHGDQRMRITASPHGSLAAALVRRRDGTCTTLGTLHYLTLHDTTAMVPPPLRHACERAQGSRATGYYCWLTVQCRLAAAWRGPPWLDPWPLRLGTPIGAPGC